MQVRNIKTKYEVKTTMKLENVFGISSRVNKLSYIDRGNLDTRVQRLLNRDMHIALNGASKSGKSWLMQQCIANANIVQCRLNESIQEVYAEALANLGGKSELCRLPNSRGILEASREGGISLLDKNIEKGEISKEKNTISDLNTLRIIANLAIESGRKLVIENFHYLSASNQTQFAFDLKTLWDYGCYVIVIGIWTKSNLLTSLNADLNARIEEIPVVWNKQDLRMVLKKGCENLNVMLTDERMSNLVENSFGNVGILQTLAYNTLEEENIFETWEGKPKRIG